MTATLTEPAMSDAERNAVLDNYLAGAASAGWRIETRSTGQAQLVKGKPTNHLLHLILSIVTLGFWIPVWIAVAIFSGQKQKYVTVDPAGRLIFS